MSSISDAKSQLKEIHELLCQKVKTGIEMELGVAPDFGNVAGFTVLRRDFASLCQLLIDKGVIRETELISAMVTGMREELQETEKRLNCIPGLKVKL